MRVCKQGCDFLDSRVLFRNIFLKAIEDFFRVYIASSKQSEGGGGGAVMKTLACVSGFHNCLEFSQPPSLLDEAI